MADKLNEMITIRVSSILKNHLDKLPLSRKSKLYEDVRWFMAERLHGSLFNPEDWGLTKDDRGD
ncbi:MAG: hypothetical protein HQL06_15920 [Nitrospirae bacterium]|nr:hypothetical protein [Nitrospirota bacterium]